MNEKKLKDRETRLKRAKSQIEARQKLLQERGLDAAAIQKDSTMRKFLAEARKVNRSIVSLKGRLPKTEQAEKPAKKSAKQKAPKPPKQKQPKKEEPVPEPVPEGPAEETETE